MNVPYSYLDRQFADIDAYLEDIRQLIKSGDFTLGSAVTEFEEKFARMCGHPYAIGVGTGTDALILSMEILGISAGDEVITAANTFIATVGAIAMTGARPVFVDNNEEYTIDVRKIEAAVTSKTKAIVPVHLTGCPADMPVIMEIARKYNLIVVEDAAQSILAAIAGRHVGAWGETAAFSLHPLKNLNVWGDGGMIVTRSEKHYKKLRLYRNHGLKSRDEVEIFGRNCRLDSLQAVIGNRLIKDVQAITEQRIKNAKILDDAFKKLEDFITLPPRRPHVKQVYHTYVIQVKDRNELLSFLREKGIQAKVHYPIPVHLQEAARHLGYKRGDFPICERHCETVLTLPVHQHLTSNEMDYMIETVRQFYKQKYAPVTAEG